MIGVYVSKCRSNGWSEFELLCFCRSETKVNEVVSYVKNDTTRIMVVDVEGETLPDLLEKGFDYDPSCVVDVRISSTGH